MHEPTYTRDPEVTAAYLMLDDSKFAARTEVAQVSPGSATVALDYDENDNLIGIEVLW